MEIQRRLVPMTDGVLVSATEIPKMAIIIATFMQEIGCDFFTHFITVLPGYYVRSVRAFSPTYLEDFVTFPDEIRNAGAITIADMLSRDVESRRYCPPKPPTLTSVRGWKIGISSLEEDDTRIMVAEAEWVEL